MEKRRENPTTRRIRVMLLVAFGLVVLYTAYFTAVIKLVQLVLAPF